MRTWYQTLDLKQADKKDIDFYQIRTLEAFGYHFFCTSSKFHYLTNLPRFGIVSMLVLTISFLFSLYCCQDEA